MGKLAPEKINQSGF